MDKGAGKQVNKIGKVESSSKPKQKGKQWKTLADVGEEFKIGVGTALEEFAATPERLVLDFPVNLTNYERAYIHKLAGGRGFKTKSEGVEGVDRHISVSKKFMVLTDDAKYFINLSDESFSYLKRSRPPLDVMCHELSLASNGGKKNWIRNISSNKSCSPKIPPRVNRDTTLPINQWKKDIIEAIETYNVVLICGETGCGKTTQVPQMILDECSNNKQPCRIFCTQPRRLAAVSVADRVANERSEELGSIVGYQISLESKVSPQTLLTYCTCGVLLRIMMSQNGLKGITHIIVDEVHERDKYCDFLLTALKLSVTKYPNLKLILMSASMNTELFAKYLNCPTISVPVKVFQVEEYFLEDVLEWTNFSNKGMDEYMKRHGLSLLAREKKAIEPPRIETLTLEPNEPEPKEDTTNSLDSWVRESMDDAIKKIMVDGDLESFHQIYHLILDENVSVNYKHSDNEVTILMAAATRGMVEQVQQLIQHGAAPGIATSLGVTASSLAEQFGHTDVMDVLQPHIDLQPHVDLDSNKADEDLRGVDLKAGKTDTGLSPKKKMRLDAYNQSFNQQSFKDDKIDYGLVLALIKSIIQEERSGAILVFLPGYKDIMAMKNRILDSDYMSSCSLFVLHSSVNQKEQRKVFDAPSPGIRKIILSTNIAETSLTIEDVVFVINCGKVKEKSFEALGSLNSLDSNWVSKANCLQRKGRAGRCQTGVCYHLMSRTRFDSLPAFQVPELLRTPLHDVCLNVKLLSVGDITSFLCAAPEAPGVLLIQEAVKLLKTIGALDVDEQLTYLGRAISHIPADPCLAKCLLFGVLLQCLDPILTIVSSQYVKDPFILPADSSELQFAKKAKAAFSKDSMSDHLGFLAAFEDWHNAKRNRKHYQFCRKHYLAPECMQMIEDTKRKLRNELTNLGFFELDRNPNLYSSNLAMVKAALCAGFYPNLARWDRDSQKLMTRNQPKLSFHPSSVLDKVLAKGHNSSNKKNMNAIDLEWYLFQNMNRAGTNANIECVTPLPALTVALFCGDFSQLVTPAGSGDDSISRDDIMKVTDWIKLHGKSVKLLTHARKIVGLLLAALCEHPTSLLGGNVKKFLAVISHVLRREDPVAREQLRL